jgi:hypothetical protein
VAKGSQAISSSTRRSFICRLLHLLFSTPTIFFILRLQRLETAPDGPLDPSTGKTVASGSRSGTPDGGAPVAGIGVARSPPESPACLLTVIFSSILIVIYPFKYFVVVVYLKIVFRWFLLCRLYSLVVQISCSIILIIFKEF